MKPPEWCEKAARRFNSCADKDCPDCALAAAIIAEEHEKGCEFVHGEAEALRKLADIKQAVRELVEAAKQSREVAAAAFRIAALLGHWNGLESELEKAGVEKGFGKRLQSAIGKVEELL